MGQWFNWNVKTRLAAGFCLLGCTVLVVAALALNALNTAHKDFELQVHEVEKIQSQVSDLQNTVNTRAIQARNLVIAASEERIQVSKSQIATSHAEVQSGLRDLQAAVASLNPPEPGLQKALADVSKTEAAYGPVALDITELGATGQREKAIAKINVECQPLLDQLIANLQALSRESARISQANVASSEQDFHSMTVLLMSVSAGALALALVLGLGITRSITRPLRRATEATKSFASGDLSHAMAMQGRDEFSQMLAALEDMRQKLKELVTTVRDGADAVSTASSEIAQGNHDLSTRTETQASALEETAASMEQLASTVQQNSDNAQQGNQLAQNASSVAADGGRSVGDVVHTMQGIHESSKKIADITSVIDGIAFQTNILALNAAVEAARAGEQGRGFAVVAAEVRQLASRSAQAAKEIKSLINDSVERIELGSTQVNQAGTTMAGVVQSIQGVADIMSQISHASAEQSSGVHQIDHAVTEMDQTTQQNAALVEQMAAAADAMRTQAKELVRAVAVFKLS